MAKSSVHTGNEPALKALGLAVRELRISRNLSQEALADLAGLDRSYTGGIERGEHNVALINIQRIAQALDMKVSALMGYANL
ncbi:MAG: helix-turn-helix domain-containing protein [Polynucleobacter sp.]|nr:helix-turn-helix domain-containing protein [Polynucleobacter sp.]